MSALGDAELLAALADALAEPEVQMPQEVRTRVAEALRVHQSARRRRILRPVPAVAGLVLALGTTAGAVAAAGVPLPPPLRAMAVAVGLPVDDAHVATVKTDIAKLHDAVTAGDREGVLAGTAALIRDLRDLSPADRSEVEQDALSALAAAQRFLDDGTATSSSATGGGSPTPASRPLPDASAAPPPLPSGSTSTDGQSGTGPAGGRDSLPENPLDGEDGGMATGSTPGNQPSPMSDDSSSSGGAPSPTSPTEGGDTQEGSVGSGAQSSLDNSGESDRSPSTPTPTPTSPPSVSGEETPSPSGGDGADPSVGSGSSGS